MQTRPLGRTGLTVPVICLGTMTWGAQNSEAEGHAQMDMAMEAGATFFDAAEMYPTAPVTPETQGRTEEIIGSWFKASGRRSQVTLATKIAGGSAHIRDAAPITGETITQAVETSLKRLGTDCIDLYQLHWPGRGHYHFRRQWAYDPSTQAKGEMDAHVEDVLGTCARLIEAGKIRAVGLSNETTWGTMAFLRAAEVHGLPRVASIQNEYSLLYRTVDLDLAEMAHHEEVGLLAYSPLAAGLLTGKYAGGAIPAGSRGSINKGLGGRLTPRGLAAADAYVALARDHGLDPAQMAIAFCLTRPFMTSAIIGATTLGHLETALGAADITLGSEVLEGIAALHKAHPSPY